MLSSAVMTSTGRLKGSRQLSSQESKEELRELPRTHGDLPKAEVLRSDLPRDRDTCSDLPDEPVSAPAKLMLLESRVLGVDFSQCRERARSGPSAFV